MGATEIGTIDISIFGSRTVDAIAIAVIFIHLILADIIQLIARRNRGVN